MIIAVSSVKDEADIIEQTINHLRGEGVDRFVISNGGGTGCINRIKGVRALPQIGPFDQGVEITRLAYIAADMGADWIIPFDADEFWIDPLGTTVREVLEGLPADCLKVHCAVFKHADWDTKYVTQNPMGKVAFRPTEEMTIAWGNHDVQLSRPGNEEHGLLEIRELQYRDYDHFYAKVQKARQLFASWDVPMHHGYHMRVLADLPDDQLPTAYALLCQESAATIDPIPRRP